MTKLNKQTTFRLQTLHALILLMLFSAFGIGKCHASQQGQIEEDNAALTTEVRDGYLVMKPASSSSNASPANVASTNSAHSFSNGQYVNSQQSIISSGQFYNRDDTTNYNLYWDDYEDETVPGATRHSSYYDELDLNNFSNGQRSNISISTYAESVPQYKYYISMLSSRPNNNIPPGTSEIRENFQYQDAITADQRGSETNGSHHSGGYKSDEGMEDEEGSTPEVLDDKRALSDMCSTIYKESNSNVVNASHENTPTDSIAHGDSANLRTPYAPKASKDNVLNQNVSFTTQKMAGGYNITWLYYITTLVIFWQARYLFKTKILAKEGSSIGSIFKPFDT